MTVGYLFDLDRTLVTYDPGIPGIFRAACETAGVEPTDAAADAIVPGYIDTFVDFEESPYIGAARAAHEAGLDITPESFADVYIETELAATHVHDGVVDLVASLDHVGVVTNGYGPVQRQKLTDTGLDAHIDTVVCADDVEAFKPDDPPFDAVTDALPAEDYVMVGDNIDYDIRPAANRGYQTVLVGGPDDTSDLADYHLPDATTLPSLPEVLSG